MASVESKVSHWGITLLKFTTSKYPSNPFRHRHLCQLSPQFDCRAIEGADKEREERPKGLKLSVYESIAQPFTSFTLTEPHRPENVEVWECEQVVDENIQLHFVNQEHEGVERPIRIWGVRQAGQPPVIQVAFLYQSALDAGDQDPLGLRFLLQMKAEGWQILPDNLAYFDGCLVFAYKTAGGEGQRADAGG